MTMLLLKEAAARVINSGSMLCNLQRYALALARQMKPARSTCDFICCLTSWSEVMLLAEHPHRHHGVICLQSHHMLDIQLPGIQPAL